MARWRGNPPPLSFPGPGSWISGGRVFFFTELPVVYVWSLPASRLDPRVCSGGGLGFVILSFGRRWTWAREIAESTKSTIFTKT